MSVKPKLVRVTANCIKLRHETASLQCNNSACRKLVVLAAPYHFEQALSKGSDK